MPGRDGTGPLGLGPARFTDARAGLDWSPTAPSRLGDPRGVSGFGRLGGLGRGGCYRGTFCAPLASRYAPADEVETLKAYRDLIDSRINELTKPTEGKNE